jgi:hypothetical protein
VLQSERRARAAAVPASKYLLQMQDAEMPTEFQIQRDFQPR